MRVAAIDIGTNSVLLTIAEQNESGEFVPLCEEARITRIGQGLGTGRHFLPEAMARTLRVLQDYAEQCQKFAVQKIITVGTAAFRRALNAEDFISRVQKDSGLDIQIISGTREAELSYRAAQRDFGDDLLVIDIGGGSTEFIWPTSPADSATPSAKNVKSVSLPLGSVVLHEHLVHSDPISDTDFSNLQTYIMTELLNLQSGSWGGHVGVMFRTRPAALVALAGTATTLAAMKLKLQTYSHTDVHGMTLSFLELSDQLQMLRRADIAERKQIPGIEAARADVILEGALLLHETMKLFEYDEVTISDRGVRWGLIYELESK